MKFNKWFSGSANLGIVSNDEQLLNFSTGKFVVTENKEKNRVQFYNLLVGPTEFPELAEEISQRHYSYQLEFVKSDDFITSKECKKIFGELIQPINQSL